MVQLKSLSPTNILSNYLKKEGLSFLSHHVARKTKAGKLAEHRRQIQAGGLGFWKSLRDERKESGMYLADGANSQRITTCRHSKNSSIATVQRTHISKPQFFKRLKKNEVMNQKAKWLFSKLLKHNFLYFLYSCLPTQFISEN